MVAKNAEYTTEYNKQCRERIPWQRKQ